ncbi:hypothetical protein [Thalassobacillus pellis]|uniref:hypothetical protein n=1 Tax=Thalassobacillus pellis TaxID=748008 RepID=UPI00196047FE|nr:hypothetical protein [Thalassobacillus pellis]MBM7551114.1 hypothetical protein [Thalassobacillus pellis]
MRKRKENRAPEGKGKYELDVDRMINEGMAGGKVFRHGQIDEAHEIPKQKK